jgi:hypothetical protein
MPQASLPSPRTWSANDLVTTPRLRADVSNAVAFLLQRPLFVGQRTDGHSTASGSDVPLTLDTELVDTWNGHNISGTIGSNYYAQVPGWYLVRSAPAWNYTSTTAQQFAGSFSGVSGGTAWGPVRGPLVLCGSGFAPVTQAIDLVEMTNTGPPGGSGDYVQFSALNNSGSAVSLEAASVQYPTASARWVCATSGTQPLPVPPLTAVPSPVTRAWLNANVRDTIKQLIYPPICRVVYNGSTTLPTQAYPAGTTVPLGSVTVDNYGGWSTSSNTYTAPVSGRYYVYGQMSLALSSVTTGYGCGISVNGGTTMWGDAVFFNPGAGSNFGGACVSRRVRLSAGQTISLVANQGSGGSIGYNGSAGNQPRVVIIWEGI